MTYSKLFSHSDLLAGDRANRFYLKSGVLGIGYFEDFEGGTDLTALKWSNDQQIWTLVNSAGAGSIGIAQIATGGGLAAGYAAHNTGTAPNYTLSEPLLAKPVRPMFVHDNKSWLVDYDGATGFFVYLYDTAQSAWVKASAAITATATYRMDCFCDGTFLFVAAASTTQNVLFKLSYSAGWWTVDSSANVSGAMPAQQNGNPGGGADCYNAPHLLVHGDSVGRLWLFWHTMDSTDLADWASIYFEVRAKSDLSLVSGGGPHCLVSADLDKEPLYMSRAVYGDDIINGVTFNDGTASVGLAFSSHSLVHVPDTYAGEWFVHHHDSDPITTWQTEENIEPAGTGHDDDHMATVADASGCVYCLWKSNQDGTGPILHFRKRFADEGGWDTKQTPFGTGTTAYTRPRLGLYGSEVWAVAMLGNNIVGRKADLATMTWDAADSTLIDAAGTVNNPCFPKDTANSTSRLLCCAHGADNVRYFAVCGGAQPPSATKNYLFVKSPTSGTDYDRSSAKFNLPPGLSALAKYTVTFGEARGRSYTTPFATPTNTSTSTNRARFHWAWNDSSNGACGADVINSGNFRAGWQPGTAALTYCAAGSVASAIPKTLKVVVSGSNVNQHAVTHNGTAYSTAADNAVVVGAANTLALQACWMNTGGLQHESLADYVWLEGGLGSGNYTSAWNDAGADIEWATLALTAALTGDQSATVSVHVSADGVNVLDSVTGLTLVNGANSLDISELPVARYVRFVLSFDCGTTASTPTATDIEISGTEYVAPEPEPAPASIPQRGIPELNFGTGIFADAEVQARLRQVEQPEVSFAGLIDSILAELAGAVVVVVDPFTRKVYAADAPADKSALSAATVAGGALATIVSPEPGQTGRSLTWADPDPDPGFDSDVQSAALAVVEPARPRRTVAGLLAQLLNALPADQWPLVRIDQDSASVNLTIPAARATAVAALDSLPLDSGSGVKIELASDAPAGGPLIWEGGAT